MGEEQHAWVKQAGESAKWYSRFVFYLDMGPNRTLLGAVHEYEIAEHSRQKQTKTDLPPLKLSKKVPGAWNVACEQDDWKSRAVDYDEHKRIEEEKRKAALDALEQTEKERILRTGYALMHKRIEALDAMARTIDGTMKEDPLADTYFAQWVTPDKVREWRGCLDDIARELGERVKVTKGELTGANGGPIETESTQTIFYLPNVNLPDDEESEDDSNEG